MSNLLPINTYFGKLVEACLGEIGQNGTPAMILTFELTHEAQNGAWNAITEVRRDCNIWFSDKAREGSFADLRTLGFNGDFDAPRFSEDLYAGVELLIEHEMYQGKTNERLRIGKLKRGSNAKPVSADVKRTLAAQFKTAAGAAARPTTPPPPPGGAQRTVAKPAGTAAPAAAPVAPAPTDDSVPF